MSFILFILVLVIGILLGRFGLMGLVGWRMLSKYSRN